MIKFIEDMENKCKLVHDIWMHFERGHNHYPIQLRIKIEQFLGV